MRYLNYILLGLGGVLAALAVAFFLFDTAEPTAVQPQVEKSATTTVAGNDANKTVVATEVTNASNGGAEAVAKAANETATAEIEYTLTIDVARVKPDGSAVFAGQGAPGAKIRIFEGDVLLGNTVADANGEWVVILEKPLAPGQHLVSVAMETENGDTQLADISLAIEIAETGDEQPLVALLPQQETDVPQLLQSPDDQAPEASVTQADVVSVASLAPRALFWRDGNVLGISGVSRGGIRVDATIDGSLFAESLVLADGQWQITGQLASQKSNLIVDFALYDDGGQQVATYQLPLRTRDLDVGMDGSEMVIVQRGDALWRIAYRSYGKGVRYVDIVRRNAAAINDPDLIYPNQIFAIPK